MPDQQPNNANDDLPEAPRDESSIAAVLNDADGDKTPGGGGLGGAAAADRLGGSGRAPGGPSPNAPIDPNVDAGTTDAAPEAQVRATTDAAPEPHPSSQ